MVRFKDYPVGIDVHRNRVTFAPEHNKRVDHRPSVNPVTHRVGDMRVKAIFRRVSYPGGGDGNALIYALKKRLPYRISIRDVNGFLPDFYTILANALAGKQNMVIIPLPSSQNIAKILAKRAQQTVPGSQVVTNLLRKKFSHEVLADLRAIDLPRDDNIRSDGNRLKAALESADPESLFQMKQVVNTKLRKYIQPLTLSSARVQRSDAQVLLVDDLLSSGTTFQNALDALKTAGFGRSHEGLCLLGAVTKPRR